MTSTTTFPIKMSKYIFLILLILSYLLMACDIPIEESEEETLETIETSEDFQALEEKIEEEEHSIEEKRTERNQEGDTIALSSQTLENYLPKKIDKYNPSGQVVGSPYQASGTSFASVEQNYNAGNNQLRITVTDYNGINTQHAQSIAMWKSGLRIDNRRELAGSFEMDKMIGWEIYHKKEKKAEIMLAVSDRILISAIANNQNNTDYLKSILQKINLKDLAKF